MTAHTDHPMRNWDRTCPACQEKYEKVTEKGKKYLEIYEYMPWPISYAEALDAGQDLNKKDLANAFREAQEKIDQLTAMTKEPTKLMAIPALMEAAGWVRKKEWVGLTDEEILKIEDTTTFTGNESWLRNLTRNLEAKLKEKNGG